MSDNWLQYVPREHTFKPSHEAAERAKSLLASFAPEAEEVVCSYPKGVTLFHPGCNWSGVQCPSCGAEAESWWSDATDREAEEGFKSLDIKAPCCDATVSLNRMRYGWPTAFGSFVLEAMNPNIKGLSGEQLSQLEAALGCQLHEVPLHL
jgi:hypothetical protein